jgi:hypothetical protein
VPTVSSESRRHLAEDLWLAAASQAPDAAERWERIVGARRRPDPTWSQVTMPVDGRLVDFEWLGEGRHWVAQAAGSIGLASTGPAQLERLGELGWTAARSAPEAILVAAALGLALVARDPRAAIAAVVLVAPGLARALERRAWLSPLASWYWLVIAVTVPLLVMAVVSANRRQRIER